ncbi:FAD-dependent monooxygenase [Spongiactinospora sp. 9N601]|uniref:FAD-dependent monooxygenase n=1 Tax=Spongiactinospora sp. 9N601 TaxID=3375149 RepID=UPI0037ACE402
MKAIIIGGGIGGMAAAAAFTMRGAEVVLLERAPAFAEIGAGIALLPNALRALDMLGLGEPLREHALSTAQAGVRDAAGRWLSRVNTADLERRYGQWVMIHRADLLDVLRAKVPPAALRPGTEVRDVRPDGTVVHAGGTLTGDLVVGADGLRSVTRRSLWPDAPAPRYAGYTTWRWIVPPMDVGEGLETWGRGQRFGYATLPDGRVYCYAMYAAPPGTTCGLADLRRRYAGWHHPIPALLDGAQEGTLLQHDTYELPDLATFVSGRTALLGDAAHAMTPNVGQGACQALEDAVVLAAEVAERGTAAGLRAYDLARRPRTQMVVRRSRRIGLVAQWTAPPLVALRDTVMRMMPYATFVRSFRPLVDWPPASGAERPAVGTGAPPPAGSLRDH